MKDRGHPHITIAAWVGGILFALIGVLLVLSSDAFQVVEAPTTGIIFGMAICAAIGTVIGGALTKEFVMAFLTCGMLAGPTFVLVRFGYLPAINSAFDDSPGRTHRVRILKVHRRKALLTRKIEVESWRGNPDGELIHVQVDLVERSPTHVELTLRAGALGYEWISAMKPLYRSPR